jgi:transcription elongation factor GreB
MNKAFVKEDSENFEYFDIDMEMTEEDLLLEESGESFGPVKNYITRPGFEKLQAEMNHLVHQERPKVLGESIGIEQQLRLREIDRRIRFLQKRIDRAEIVDLEKQNTDRVLFGATVTVSDENEEKRIYQIVGMDEAAVRSGKISWSSPIAKALLQSRVGDYVTVRTPHGDEELEIQKIEYKSIN